MMSVAVWIPQYVESLRKRSKGPPVGDFKANLCCYQKRAFKYAGLPGCPIFALYFRTTMFWEMVLAIIHY